MDVDAVHAAQQVGVAHQLGRVDDDAGPVGAERPVDAGELARVGLRLRSEAVGIATVAQ